MTKIKTNNVKKLCLSKTDSETSSKHSLTKVTKQRDKQKVHEHKKNSTISCINRLEQITLQWLQRSHMFALMINSKTMKDFVSAAAPGGHDEDSTIFCRLPAAHFRSANFS